MSMPPTIAKYGNTFDNNTPPFGSLRLEVGYSIFCSIRDSGFEVGYSIFCSIRDLRLEVGFSIFCSIRCLRLEVGFSILYLPSSKSYRCAASSLLTAFSTNLFKLISCAAAKIAASLCSSGEMRTLKQPL